jgi:hypothetical protein
MKAASDPGITPDAVPAKLKQYAPWIPAIFAVQVLSTVLANTAPVKNSKALRSIFGASLPISTLLLLAFVALKDMRESTTEEFKNELKGFVGFSKYKDQNNPFTVVKIGSIEESFTNLDQLAQSLGKMGVAVAADRASRSFDAARRTVIPGWEDPYHLRVAEFLAIRSVEQSMHEMFKQTVSNQKQADPNWVTSLTKSRDYAFNEDGTPKACAVEFHEFVRAEIQGIGNMYDVLRHLEKLRDCFAHRDEAENVAVFRLDLAPFQLARVCLQYRARLPQ